MLHTSQAQQNLCNEDFTGYVWYEHMHVHEHTMGQLGVVEPRRSENKKANYLS